MNNFCKKCLLYEAGEKEAFKTVNDYLNNLDENLKVADKEAKRRLSFCKKCDYLISGMCLKCGCYVEIRVSLKDKECPNIDNKKW